jgi:rubrerythrin
MVTMKHLQERLLAVVFAERDWLMSPRGLLSGVVKFGMGGALAFAAVGAPMVGPGGRALAKTEFKTDAEVLNYALTLEHLEYAFYRDGIGQFTFGMDPFGNSIDTALATIRDHEQSHVETLTKVVGNLAGTPVAEATYDFGYGSDMQKFLATAAALENTGVSAYVGAGKFFKDPDLLTAAAGIAAVEARHASYLNLVTGAKPFPGAFERAMEPDAILKSASQFIKS